MPNGGTGRVDVLSQRFPAKNSAADENPTKFTNIMGAYKGRVNLRHRKKRFVKEQRLKAAAISKKENATAVSSSSPEGPAS
jgi:hypothetical protein